MKISFTEDDLNSVSAGNYDQSLFTPFVLNKETFYQKTNFKNNNKRLDVFSSLTKNIVENSSTSVSSSDSHAGAAAKANNGAKLLGLVKGFERQNNNNFNYFINSNNRTSNSSNNVSSNSSPISDNNSFNIIPNVKNANFSLVNNVNFNANNFSNNNNIKNVVIPNNLVNNNYLNQISFYPANFFNKSAC